MTITISNTTRIFRLHVFSGLLILAFATCGWASHHQKDETTAKEVKEQVAETYETMKNYTIEQKDDAMAAAKEKMAKLDANIDQLQNKMEKGWQNMSQEARQKSQEMMKSLRKQREEVSEWYGGLRHSSGEAWEDVKKGFAESYDQLEKAFRDAKKSFDE